MTDVRPRGDAGPRHVRGDARPASLAARLAGPWRVAVADKSMHPAIAPGDWLLVDPTTARWPRRGTMVVFREPESGMLAIKRVAARPGDWVPFADGWLEMGDDEAWLIGDATDAQLEAIGAGTAVDSRRYGPVPVTHLAGRAWLRYGPPGRPVGRIAAAPPDLIERGRAGAMPVTAGTIEASDPDLGRDPSGA